MAEVKEQSTDVEPSAQELIREYGKNFVLELINDARIRAIQQHRKITISDVENAWNRLRNEKYYRSRRTLRETLIFLGGALFSVLVETTLTSPDNISPLQVILGIVGLLLVFVALLIDI